MSLTLSLYIYIYRERERVFANPQTVAHQAPLSMGVSRQEH